MRGNVGGETIENTGIIDQMWQDDAMTFVRKFARTEDEGGREGREGKEGKERREGNEGQGDREDREGVPCCGLDSDRVYRFLRITAGLSPLPPVLGAKAGKGQPSQMNGDRSLLRGDSYDDNDPYHMKRAALKGKYKDLYRNDPAADDAPGLAVWRDGGGDGGGERVEGGGEGGGWCDSWTEESRDAKVAAVNSR